MFVKPPERQSKFTLKMTPHILVSVGIGPGFIWNKTYAVVKLSRLIGDKRSSRACIRHTCDIMFPDIPSFPVKQKLNLTGAIGDKNMPGPAIADDGKNFGILEDDEEDDSDDQDNHLEDDAREPITTSHFEAIVLDPEDGVPEDSEDEQIAKIL